MALNININMGYQLQQSGEQVQQLLDVIQSNTIGLETDTPRLNISSQDVTFPESGTVNAALQELKISKQDKLTAGDNVNISDNVISASSPDPERQVVSFINMGQQYADPSSAGVYYNGYTKEIETWEGQSIDSQISTMTKTEHHTPLVTVVYCDGDTDKLYRWNGTTMVPIVAVSGEWVRLGSIRTHYENNIAIPGNLKDYRKIKIFRDRTDSNAALTATVSYEIVSGDGTKVLGLGYHNDGNRKKEFTCEDIGLGFECHGVSINSESETQSSSLIGWRTHLYPEWIDDSCKYRIRTTDPPHAWDDKETIVVYGQKR